MYRDDLEAAIHARDDAQRDAEKARAELKDVQTRLRGVFRWHVLLCAACMCTTIVFFVASWFLADKVDHDRTAIAEMVARINRAQEITINGTTCTLGSSCTPTVRFDPINGLGSTGIQIGHVR